MIKLNQKKINEIKELSAGEIIRFSLGEKCFKVHVLYEERIGQEYFLTFGHDLELENGKTVSFKLVNDLLKFIHDEANRKLGRPIIGVTKKVSITMPLDEWEEVADSIKKGYASSMSEYFRLMHNGVKFSVENLPKMKSEINDKRNDGEI
jgi:hypothetical protein